MDQTRRGTDEMKSRGKAEEEWNVAEMKTK
jgi:hypothetical protein